MNPTRLNFYIRIKDCRDAGLDSLAFFLMEWHDKLFPSEPSIRQEYDKAVLERLNDKRNLKEL